MPPGFPPKGQGARIETTSSGAWRFTKKYEVGSLDPREKCQRRIRPRDDEHEVAQVPVLHGKTAEAEYRSSNHRRWHAAANAAGKKMNGHHTAEEMSQGKKVDNRSRCQKSIEPNR